MREAALAGDATLHGTGIAPGGISEKFPLMLSAMSTGVTFVRAEEFSDLRTYEAPDVLRHVMGFGETPDKALTGPMQKMLDTGFIQAVQDVRQPTGFRRRPEGAADPGDRGGHRDRSTPRWGRSSRGRSPAANSTGRRLVAGEPVVRVTVNWLMGEDNLDPAWSFGPAGQRYEMEVRGQPGFHGVGQGFSVRGRRGRVPSTASSAPLRTASTRCPRCARRRRASPPISTFP